MLKKAINKLGLFYRIAQRADPCSFATIPNALKQCAAFANSPRSFIPLFIGFFAQPQIRAG